MRARRSELFEQDRGLATKKKKPNPPGKKKNPSGKSGGVDVFYPGLAGSTCYRIPTIIRSPKNTLLAFAENRKKNCKDMGDHDIVLRRSSDRGKTWGKMVTVAKGKGSAFANANPVAVGNRILVHFVTQNNPKGSQHGSNMQTWSSDDGQSWSAPTKVKFTNAQNLGKLIGPSVGIISSNNTIYFVTHSTGTAQLYWSNNNGGSWTVSSQGVKGMNECSIAFLVSPADGRIAMNCRTPKGNRAQTVWSRDGKIIGGTTYVKGMSDPNCQGSIILANNKLWVSHPNSKTSRANMIVQESGNQGKTWSSGIEVNRGPAAYSQLVNMGGATKFLGLAYETRPKNVKGTITFQVVK
jgi:sialidase-1